MAFREHPDAWTRVDTILESSTNPQTKYIALQVLENLIKYRWKTLPATQRDGIRTYLVQKVIALSQDERTLRSESVLVGKLNLLLVQVLKHEWPNNWVSFIPDLVGSSKCVAWPWQWRERQFCHHTLLHCASAHPYARRTSEVLCENNVNILKLLSEEIFDFSKECVRRSTVEAYHRASWFRPQQIRGPSCYLHP